MKKVLFYAVFFASVMFLFCAKNAGGGIARCRENCHYIRADCMADCRPNSIEFSFDLKPGGENRNRVFTCGERCAEYYAKCIRECKSL